MEAFAAQLLESGVVAGLFGMLLWWMTQRQEQMMRQMTRQISITNLLVVGLQKELLVHDLTVTGINPSTGEDVEQRAKNALQKYEEVRQIMETIQQTIQVQASINK